MNNVIPVRWYDTSYNSFDPYMTEIQTKTCQNCKQQFTIEPEDFDFYKKINVPPPTFCSDCREQRRIAFRNERALYKRKCDLCGKEIVARVSPDKPYPMYCNPCWWSDKWDPRECGREYDFSKPFFEQFKELLQATPHSALGALNNVNSDWVNQETDSKNCYLNVGGHFNEDSGYNTYELYGRDSFDNFWLLHGELCYECINCERCYRVLFSRDCFDCRNVTLSFDCRNCSDCFGCAGLRNKQYHIFNKPVSKSEYEDFLKNNPFSSHHAIAELTQKAMNVWNAIPRRERFALKSVNVFGNYITESKNATDVWNVEKIEDAKHLFIAAGMKDSYDGSSIGWGELCYEGAHTVGAYNAKFVAFSFGGKAETRQSSDLEYCMMTGNSNHCFGCVSIRGKEYCILNKQYAPEKYKELAIKIRKHMCEVPYEGKNGRMYAYGEFFPIELSPFGYNETAAMDYFPLTRDEALTRGYSWSDYEAETSYTFSDYEIPDDIRDVKDDILERVLRCEVSGKPYRVIPTELQFYRRMGLPIPRHVPLQRHKDRMGKLLPRKLFSRSCECGGKTSLVGRYANTTKHFHDEGKCPNVLQTPYVSNRPEIVYCETCYQAEVV